MTDEQLLSKLKDYCSYYKIPEEFLFDILEDQKVVPMIRGKSTEYNVYLLLKDLLNPHEWVVSKLNLNAQTGTHDEDVTITHQRTGIIVKVECKNATRGSMKHSNRAKISKEPFCTIKLHKSRSDLAKADTTNDRYLKGDFDFVISNLSNAVIEGATYTERFLLKDDDAVKAAVTAYYGCNYTFEEVFEATFNDYRFALAEDLLLEDDSIPRTPPVLLNGGDAWHPISEFETYLNDYIFRNRNRRGRR